MNSDHTKIILQELKYIYGFQFRYLDDLPIWYQIKKHGYDAEQTSSAHKKAQKLRRHILSF